MFKISPGATTLVKLGTLAAKAGAHSFTQGVVSTVLGGNFWSGVLSAAFTSVSNDLLGLAGEGSILASNGFALFSGAVTGGVGSVLGGGNFWMGAGQGLIVTAFNFLAHKETTVVEENNTDGDCSTCPKNAKNGQFYTEDYTIFDKEFWTWDNISNGRRSYSYWNDEWKEIKPFAGTVPIGPAGSFNILKLKSLKSALSLFKGGKLTNAGRAVTKHPEYFGFESTEALMKVFRSPSAINNLGATTVKNILRNGVRTTGSGGRYPQGWVTYTLPNGNAASWTVDGIFIGFRGLK
ncbi:hypothetical protein IQ37_12640 [Chryseobacterium piperi]|uniref:Uncharacterized protein n=1 Tax=Chryseobacterium piperi TaxID=558152 RepID=A0A086B8I5_9FLAO|nr:hypothetical protein [Chryseobacterium piperi]ATL75973.1 hypothetical protein CJF12_20000 [Chryseobacterium piperi]KFF25249.1 hypothetical protein IQ37_12640 [Chryseobacterium piperi]